MSPRSTTKYWIGLSILAAISVSLSAGWWLDHQVKSTELDEKSAAVNEKSAEVDALSAKVSAQAAEIEALGSRIESILSQPWAETLRTENSDLMLFIDEVYALLWNEGIHIQLDIDVDEDGNGRLRADSAKLVDELKAKLRELKQETPNI